jgi:hypothetical protein
MSASGEVIGDGRNHALRMAHLIDDIGEKEQSSRVVCHSRSSRWLTPHPNDVQWVGVECQHIARTHTLNPPAETSRKMHERLIAINAGEEPHAWQTSSLA